MAEFLPGKLPLSSIDPEKRCLLSFDTGAVALSISAGIEHIEEGKKLILSDLKPTTSTQAQKRDYFRVSAQLPINLEKKEAPQEDEPDILIIGEAVNISGSGILVSFPEPYEPIPINKRVILNIPLPEPQLQTISCIGIVMRDDVRDDGTHMVGFRFEGLENDDQDRIIAYCLAQQRQELQLKVQILGNAPA